MRMLLQQGHAMMPLAQDFLLTHHGSGVIMSPRAYKVAASLPRDAAKIRGYGGAVLLDPQFYQPRTDHPNIVQQEYWQDLDFTTGDFDPTEFCRRVIAYQLERVVVDEVILPGRFTESADEPWRDLQMTVADLGRTCAAGLPIHMTVAVGPGVVTSRSTFDAVLDQAVSYPVEGIYLLTPHPSNRFLADDESFLYALLDGCLSLRRAGKRVILGYANQQALLFGAAGVVELASGNFRNTRSFDPGMFYRPEPEPRDRATWYYDAGTLGEYRPAQLSLAYNRPVSLRGRFGPSCTWCRQMLDADDPASVPWGERDAFLHFLHELHRQWTELRQSGPTAAQRAGAVQQLFQDAATRTEALQTDGFMTGARGFTGAPADATAGALAAFRQDRAADLSRVAV